MKITKGIFADRIDTIRIGDGDVRDGKLDAGRILSLTAIDAILAQDGLKVREGGILAGTGIDSIIVYEGGVLSSTIATATGNIRQIRAQGGPLESSIRAPLGSVTWVNFQGSFTTSAGQSILVQADPTRGRIGEISGGIGAGEGVGLLGGLPQGQTLTARGSISAASIGTIDVGAIGAASITATNGNLDYVRAKGWADFYQGQILATLQATGNIRQVEGGWITGNILAKRRDLTNAGGNIEKVTFHAAFDPQDPGLKKYKAPGLILADNGIGTLLFQGGRSGEGSTPITGVTVKAQGGLDFTGIQIQASGTFKGTVVIDYGGAVDVNRFVYADNDTLLMVTDDNGVHSWKTRQNNDPAGAVWVTCSITPDTFPPPVIGGLFIDVFSHWIAPLWTIQRT